MLSLFNGSKNRFIGWLLLFLRNIFFYLFINIHTHFAPVENELAIRNYAGNTLETPRHFFSAGLHPWHVDDDWPVHFTLLQKLLQHQHAIALGECGLDKTRTTNWLSQQKAFEAQINLANSLQLPLVVHCVRAHEEVLQQLKKSGNTQPVIFHGFNKNRQLAERIIAAGHYLSFGHSLQQLQVREVMFATPAERIFFETDDSVVHIEEIYNWGCHTKNVSMKEMEKIVEKNFRTIFKTVKI